MTLFAAFPPGKERKTKAVDDEPVVIQCYTSEKVLKKEAKRLREFLVRMGTEARQGAVGFVIDRHYLEIAFPSREEQE
jgi:hypothetical protein